MKRSQSPHFKLAVFGFLPTPNLRLVEPQLPQGRALGDTRRTGFVISLLQRIEYFFGTFGVVSFFWM
jgi:hypothetical protein